MQSVRHQLNATVIATSIGRRQASRRLSVWGQNDERQVRWEPAAQASRVVWCQDEVKSSQRRRRRRITNGAPFAKPGTTRTPHSWWSVYCRRAGRQDQAGIEKVLAAVAAGRATSHAIRSRRSRHTTMDHVSLFRPRLLRRLSSHSTL